MATECTCGKDCARCATHDPRDRRDHGHTPISMLPCPAHRVDRDVEEEVCGLSFDAIDWDIAARLVKAFNDAAESGSADAEHAAAVGMADFLAEVESLALNDPKEN